MLKFNKSFKERAAREPNRNTPRAGNRYHVFSSQQAMVNFENERLGFGRNPPATDIHQHHHHQHTHPSNPPRVMINEERVRQMYRDVVPQHPEQYLRTRAPRIHRDVSVISQVQSELNFGGYDPLYHNEAYTDPTAALPTLPPLEHVVGGPPSDMNVVLGESEHSVMNVVRTHYPDYVNIINGRDFEAYYDAMRSTRGVIHLDDDMYVLRDYKSGQGDLGATADDIYETEIEYDLGNKYYHVFKTNPAINEAYWFCECKKWRSLGKCEHLLMVSLARYHQQLKLTDIVGKPFKTFNKRFHQLDNKEHSMYTCCFFIFFCVFGMGFWVFVVSSNLYITVYSIFNTFELYLSIYFTYRGKRY